MPYAKALAVVVTAFLAFSLPPYFTGNTRVPATFALHYPLLVGHVMFAAVAMTMAVVQIWPGLRARHPTLHRWCGRIYVATAIPAALCALIIGAATPFGPYLAVSNIVLACLWLWFTTTGYLLARRRRFGEHRRQMALSATLALSIITNRIWTPTIFISLQPLQDTVFHGNKEHYLWFAAGLGAWLGWTIPFFTVIWVGSARRGRVVRSGRRSRSRRV
ncbi:DUF2306 domain-containing protein [Mycolicibacterium sp. Dal123E01]|uniref:DUF2306 domain-containing protein n=1 Tax=Mycolicibacterium sp. Dal123E01 TaxID=3457578 RepID=UPI00403E5A05